MFNLCYIISIIKHTSAGRDHTYRVVNELLEHGYMEKVQYRCEGKILGLNYTVFEVSTGENNAKAKISNVTLSDNGEIVEISTIQPNTENQDTDNPDTVFTTLLNNNNYEVIKEIKNKEVVVVDEKQTQLLEMYKSFKLQKKVMPQTTNLIMSYIDKFDLEVFEQVFIDASEDSVKSKYRYLEDTFKKLVDKNIRTLEEYKKDNAKYKASKTSKKSNTSSSNKDYKVKTRHHNINQTFEKYTAEGLEELLKENQAAKQVKRDVEENKTSEEDNKQVEITENLINECMLSYNYFNSLDEVTRAAVKVYMKNRGGFIPPHLM